MKLCCLLLIAALSPSETLDVGQPIPFNHKIHSDKAKLQCGECHRLAASGEVYSIPRGKSCMSCHRTVAVESPAIKELKSYVDENEPVPWVRIYQIPGFVDFSHKAHSGATCTACHGDVAQQERVIRHTDLGMGACVSCHVQHGAATGCHTCHDLDE